ncbi:MAG: phosphomannomutase/phosphoglucomutase [Patescibacteria group bacterium]|nr:phosphomannomutase/phosphoglucomutase [Patescibacteria group bacterium]
MKINPEIFKAYDIRGIYPEDINEETVYNIGRAIIAFTGAKKIVVGKDIRNSSDALEKKLIAGITDQGADVIKIGVSSTPLIYHASGKLDVDVGIIITASHNPAEYNGLKLCRRNAVPIGEGTGMEEIKALSINAEFNNPKSKGKIEENHEIKKEYLEYIAGFINKSNFQQKKIVIDFANAMGILDKPVYENIKTIAAPIYLYDNYDGNFPSHEPNPLKARTLKNLQDKVIENSADFGVSYDGDADRVGFIDETGEIVPMDYITALIAKEVLKKHPGGLVLIDLRSSNTVREYIEAAGGRVDLCRVGHSLIKKQMRDEGAIFAGELSGHYYFDENFKAEISTLAVIMIINLLNETGKKLSELTAELKKYFHSGEINSEVKNKDEIMLKLKEKYKDGKLNELDGIRIDYADWWFNIRPSNTEPKLRLNLEAKTKELMEQKKEKLLNIIRN